jgi:hypothetical protein
MSNEISANISSETSCNLPEIKYNLVKPNTSNPACNADATLRHMAEEPLGASQIAEMFKVNRNQPAVWFKEISEVYPWKQLKNGNRYTPECVELMRQLKEATQGEGLTYQEWKERVKASEDYPFQVQVQQIQKKTASRDNELDIAEFIGLVHYQPSTTLAPYQIDAFTPVDLGTDRLKRALAELEATKARVAEGGAQVEDFFKQLAIESFNEFVEEKTQREKELAEIYAKAREEALQEIQVKKKAKRDAQDIAKKFEEFLKSQQS